MVRALAIVLLFSACITTKREPTYSQDQAETLVESTHQVLKMKCYMMAQRGDVALNVCAELFNQVPPLHHSSKY